MSRGGEAAGPIPPEQVSRGRRPMGSQNRPVTESGIAPHNAWLGRPPGRPYPLCPHETRHTETRPLRSAIRRPDPRHARDQLSVQFGLTCISCY